jgi:hypothetical protein
MSGRGRMSGLRTSSPGLNQQVGWRWRHNVATETGRDRRARSRASGGKQKRLEVLMLVAVVWMVNGSGASAAQKGPKTKKALTPESVAFEDRRDGGAIHQCGRRRTRAAPRGAVRHVEGRRGPRPSRARPRAARTEREDEATYICVFLAHCYQRRRTKGWPTAPIQCRERLGGVLNSIIVRPRRPRGPSVCTRGVLSLG